VIRILAPFALLTLLACGGNDHLPLDKLMDATTCMQCHPKHYADWSGSMHAYAADDPVFLAMNARGQRDTNGALGDFCVRCHAPMALQLGLTKDGLNLASIPQSAKGVTCFFCHNVKSVEDSHNNPLTLAMDDVMRGGIKNPVTSPAHGGSYDPLMDSNTNDSTMCGACHDIVTPRGVHLERTFAEWATTIFASTDPRRHLSCGQCHMIANTDVVADAPGLNVPQRNFGRHEHTFAGVDRAMTPWPGTDVQAAAIERDLKGAVAVRALCLTPESGGQISVRVDNLGAGHMWPSGAAHDRRAWVEVIAYDASDKVIFSSGVVPDDKDPEDLGDPNLAGLWDRTFKDDNTPAHFFWEVARYDSQLLKPTVTTDPNDPRYDHSTTFRYQGLGALTPFARITARVRLRALPFAVLDDLVTSHDLDPAVKAKLTTLDLSGTLRTWTPTTEDPGSHCVQ
jgi:hypothetical protein